MSCTALRVVVAHADADTRQLLASVVEELGHSIVGICESTAELRAACRRVSPGLIFSGVDMPDGNAIAALVELSDGNPTPAILVTPKTSLSTVEYALQDHVMAYLVEPVDAAQIKPTIYLVCERFKEFELLKEENEDLRQTLADRKIIERAKGIIMGQQGLSEHDAFRSLQKRAQSKRMKLVRTAQEIVASVEADSLQLGQQ